MCSICMNKRAHRCMDMCMDMPGKAWDAEERDGHAYGIACGSIGDGDGMKKDREWDG